MLPSRQAISPELAHLDTPNREVEHVRVENTHARTEKGGARLRVRRRARTSARACARAKASADIAAAPKGQRAHTATKW